MLMDCGKILSFFEGTRRKSFSPGFSAYEENY
jgi:hypothetical protein